MKQAEKLLRQGKLEGAIAEYVRLAADHPADWGLLNTLGDLYARAGDTERAVERLIQAADGLVAEGDLPRAAAVYKKVVRLDQAHARALRQLSEIATRQGHFAEAKAYLEQLMARSGDHPDALLALARLEMRDPGCDLRPTITRILTSAPDRYADVMILCDELAADGRLDAAYDCVDLVTDVALLDGDADRAIEALLRFVRKGAHVPALVRLIELCVDAGRRAPMREAQALLADAYLAVGNAVEARVIAEDLLAGDPDSQACADRLRRVLAALGIADTDAVIENVRAFRGELDESFLPGDASVRPETPTEKRVVEAPPLPEGAPATEPVPVAAPAEEASEEIEIDLSDALLALAPDDEPHVISGDGASPLTEVLPLEAVFDEMRQRAAEDDGAADAGERYRRGLEYAIEGNSEQAIAELQAVARLPLYRFGAAAALGRLYIERGELRKGVEWLERAAEAPAPSPEEGHALLYELARTLEELGESSRALAVLMELDASAGDYRDVRVRVDELSRGQRA